MVQHYASDTSAHRQETQQFWTVQLLIPAAAQLSAGRQPVPDRVLRVLLLSGGGGRGRGTGHGRPSACLAGAAGGNEANHASVQYGCGLVTFRTGPAKENEGY